MKFKIVEGTATYDKLLDLRKRMDEANKLAGDLCDELGGTPNRVRLVPSGSIGGGIAGIPMAEGKPDGWKLVASGYGNMCLPKMTKENKPILDKIASLPIISYEELNSIVGFEEQCQGFVWFAKPGVTWVEKCVLLDVDDRCDFKPNEDMIEILTSEFYSLLPD